MTYRKIGNGRCVHSAKSTSMIRPAHAREWHRYLRLNMLVRAGRITEYFENLQELLDEGLTWTAFAEKLGLALQYLDAPAQGEFRRKLLGLRLPSPMRPIRQVLVRAGQRRPDLEGLPWCDLKLSTDPAVLLLLVAGAWAVRRGQEETADAWYESLLRHFSPAQLPNWVVLRLAHNRYQAGEHDGAQGLLEYLSGLPGGSPRIKRLHALNSFYLGDYAEALALLGHPDAGDQGAQEVWLRSLEHLGRTHELAPAGDHPAAVFYRQSLETPPSPREARRSIAGGAGPAGVLALGPPKGGNGWGWGDEGPSRLEKRRALELGLLSPLQLAGIETKLARPDLVCHGLHSLKRLHRFQLGLYVMDPEVDGARAQLAVEQAWEFFRRELGLSCPQMKMAATQTLEPSSTTSASQDAWSAGVEGMCNSLWPDRPGGSGRGAIFCFSRKFSPYGSGAAVFNGHKAYLRLGHHGPCAATLAAHELAHALFQLDDVSPGDSPFEDPFSLMGSEWCGPLPHTYLGLRFKAACLTLRAAQQEVDRARRARKNKQHSLACRHFGQAYELDPWHLAAGVHFVKLLLRLRRRREASRVAAELLERYPSIGLKIDWAELFGLRERPLPRADQLGAAEALQVAQWHLVHGRQRAAATYRRVWSASHSGPPPPTLYCALGYAECAHWRLQRALKFFRQGVDSAPFDIHCREGYAVVLCYLGRLPEARGQLARCRRLRDPGRAPGEHSYYPALFRGRWERALAGLNRILKASPDSPEWQRMRGQLLWKLGRPEEAEEALREAARLCRGSLEQAYLRGCQGRPGQAAELARRALRRAQTRPAALELLAHLQPQEDWARQLYGWLPHWPAILIPRPSAPGS